MFSKVTLGKRGLCIGRCNKEANVMHLVAAELTAGLDWRALEDTDGCLVSAWGRPQLPGWSLYLFQRLSDAIKGF